MQSIKVPKPITYTIPDKLRWDAWWLIPSAVPRHAGEGRHPRLSIGDATVCRESTARQP